MSTVKTIKNFQLQLYLEGWIDNVGFSHRGVERTLHDAMSASMSLNDWFNTDNIDYDENFGLDFLRKEYAEHMTD